MLASSCSAPPCRRRLALIGCAALVATHAAVAQVQRKSESVAPGAARAAAPATPASAAPAATRAAATRAAAARHAVAPALAAPQADPHQALARLARRADARHVVVRFARPVELHERAALGQAGVELLAYLGDHAFFAATRGPVDAAALRTAAGALLEAQPVRTAWKLDPLILSGQYPAHARTVAPDTGEAWVAAYVLLHADVDLWAEGVPLVGAHGAVVMDELASINGLVIELPEAALAALAHEDIVQWIEPPLPMFGPLNDSNRVLTQANTVQGGLYNLSGAGVNVLVYDAGTASAGHVDFGGRLTIGDSASSSFHATHVAGTVGGSGDASGGQYRGMAPGVLMRSYGFQWSGSGTFLYTNPGDIEADYDEALNVDGVDIANNSIGSNVESNNFPCSYQGNYGVTSALIDAIVRGSLGAPFRVVWAAGNERQGSRCDIEGHGDYYSTAPPSGAKNHISVGAVNANNDTMTTFSSWGPTDDGRLRPDVTAPGCQSDADGGVTSCSGTSGYATYCGTSMAAPTVTGLCALLLEDYRVQFSGTADPRNSTLKALLIQTAVDRGNVGPDYQFGYGSVRIRDAIDFMRTGRFDEHEVVQSDLVAYRVDVIDDGQPLRITLAWDDAPGTPNVNPALVNDLDLVVIAPDGTRHYPWTLNPDAPSAPAVRTQEDHRNNVEQVLVDAPQVGAWRVEVVGTSVPDGPQPFSIAASHAIVEGGVRIGTPEGLPQELRAGIARRVVVEIVAMNEELIPGSATMWARLDDGAFQPIALTPLGDDLFEATLPPPACGDAPEFYFTVEGSASGLASLPADAPAGVFSARVGQTVTWFTDTFETELGWTTSSTDASAGLWERGAPVADPMWPYDPNSDADGSGQCWLTENAPGNTDVDAVGSGTSSNGIVRLTSPSMPVLDGGVELRFYYFLELSQPNSNDELLVQVDAGGGWRDLARYRFRSDGWQEAVFTEADLAAAGAAPVHSLRVRFVANDAWPQSVTEAAIDGVRLTSFACGDEPLGRPETPLQMP